MTHWALYHREIPDFLRELAETPPLQRLRGVGMNCGCEYTAFPRFRALAPYSRYDHSLGAALIVWHFTGDRAQAAAGLLHDVATPAFAHVVDFLRGDYLRQEATEAGTERLIRTSEELQTVLRRHSLCTEEVCDYHRYPVADNDAPRLSADRLEYSIGNMLNYGFADRAEAAAMVADLCLARGEDGAPELAFRSPETAEAFGLAALRCSEVYVSPEDRYAMQMLAELLRRALELGAIAEDDLAGTEARLIEKLCAADETAALWRRFRAMHRLSAAAEPGEGPLWRQIRAKKRCIDPLVLDRGRLRTLSPRFAEELARFLEQDQSLWLSAQD